jgi:hypothetical protein
MSVCSKEDAWDRFVLIVKPEQSGKTFVMIQKINEFLKEDNDTDQNIVNIIFCDNSLLLTKQTKARLEQDVDITTLPDIDEPYVEFSSRKDGSAKGNAGEVRESIEDGCRNVVCCTNSKRMCDLIKIISRLNNHTRQTYKFKIWLDEADKFLNYIKKKLIPITQEHENVDVYMLTATPQPIFNKATPTGEVRTMALENTTLPQYHGWMDNVLIIREDEAGSTVGFARQIADEMLYRGELTHGKKGYVPASMKKKTHRAMRDMFLQKGVAVFVVNGDGIEMTLPNGETEVIQKKEQELHVDIKRLYDQYKVHQWACIITGSLCIGRGISIQTREFIFDFGILSNCSKKTEASQNAGRLKGNFKDWENYSPPKVYTTKPFDKIAREYEEQSREIAMLAFSKDTDKEGSAIITKSEARNVVSDKDWESHVEEFDTKEEANNMLNSHGCQQKKKFKMEDGFILSSTTGKLKILSYSECSPEVIKRWKKTANMSIKETKNTYARMYIGYTDVTDNTTAKYVVRIIKRKTKVIESN